MKEGYRPEGSELLTFSNDLQKNHVPTEMRERVPLPEDIVETLAMYKETIEHEMIADFGIPEIPKQIEAEMQYIAKAIEIKAKEQLFQDELDESIYAQLQQVAIRISQFKDRPEHIQVRALPEEGYQVFYTNNAGQQIERPLNEDEQDLLFQLEMWGDQMTIVQNIDQFKTTLAGIHERAKRKPEEERSLFIQKELVKKYHAFGFSNEQIEHLIVLSEGPEDLDLKPEDEKPGMEKLKIMKDVWNQYLSAQEKSQYVKLAAGMMVAGAVEGVAPMFLGKSMDSADAKMAAIFALGYLGVEIGAGWINRHLQIDFNEFLNKFTEKQEGLNEQLARDLVFQPGENMSHGEDRGRIIAALKRSQSAFRSILSSVAQTTAPAIASTTMGLGMMLMNDWRLGLISLASAPIAMAISRRAAHRMQPIVKQTYQSESQISQEVADQLAAHQDIVLSGMRDAMAVRLQELGKAQNQLARDRLQAQLDMQYQAGTVLSSGILAGLTVGGVALRQMGVQEAGTIVTALVYSGIFRGNLQAVLYANNDLLESLGAVVEMEEIFNGFAKEESEADEHRVGASTISEFSINVQGVSLEMDGKNIIDDVNFQVPAGGVVRLEGQSGQGKTTMTRLMSGYYQPTEGEVRIGEQPLDSIKKTGPDSFYQHVAYLSQHPYIFETGDVQANLLFGNSGVSEKEVEIVLQELGLEKRFLQQGKIDVHSSVQGLSGGERARLGLGRVLLKIRSQEHGSIVFLDQPTEELDAKTEADVARLLLVEKQQHPKTTIVLISHREEFIKALMHPKEGNGLEIQSVLFEQGKLLSKT